MSTSIVTKVKTGGVSSVSSAGLSTSVTTLIVISLNLTATGEIACPMPACSVQYVNNSGVSGPTTKVDFAPPSPGIPSALRPTM